jgi:hypothetical protein
MGERDIARQGIHINRKQDYKQSKISVGAGFKPAPTHNLLMDKII